MPRTSMPTLVLNNKIQGNICWKKKHPCALKSNFCQQAMNLQPLSGKQQRWIRMQTWSRNWNVCAKNASLLCASSRLMLPGIERDGPKKLSNGALPGIILRISIMLWQAKASGKRSIFRFMPHLLVGPPHITLKALILPKICCQMAHCTFVLKG